MLELYPDLDLEHADFELKTAAGNERKTTGSYYTPDSLVQCLLDSALEPVLSERLKGNNSQDAEKLILSLKVCDPACGSGHFLIGAAHRIARRLAGVRSGEQEPSPQESRKALRDVINHCLYGVDINPMSVELCKLALWMEALDPGKPLSFLDNHIRVGNSLLGTTPELIVAGLPHGAFESIERDDKKVCSALRKRNDEERKGTQDMFHLMATEPKAQYDSITIQTTSIDESPDDTIIDIQRKSEQYHKLVVSPEYQHSQNVADAWCAAFVWKKQANTPIAPLTTDTLRRLETDPKALSQTQQDEVKRLSCQFRFFHWHLAFPEVFAHGGFDCVLGNPPWDMVELSEKEFFASRAPDISIAQTARRRQELIKLLVEKDPKLSEEFALAKRAVYGTRHFVQNCGKFPFSSTGRINLYPLFTELVAHLIASDGRAGIVVPSAISMDAYNAPLFKWLVEEVRLVSLYDFDNVQGLFPEVHRQYRLCVLTLTSKRSKQEIFDFIFNAHDTSELLSSERRVSLTLTQIISFSPNTLAPPMFSNSSDAKLAKHVYGMLGVISNGRTGQNLWGISAKRMLSLSDPGDLFRRYTELEATKMPLSASWTRLYCGKAIYQFEHRYSTFDTSIWRDVENTERKKPDFEISTEYYVRNEEVKKRLNDKKPSKWLLVYRDVTNAANERTSIAAVIPRSGCDTTCRNLYSSAIPSDLVCLLGSLNSFVFDYFTRQKVIGMHLGAGVFEQLPALPPTTYAQTAPWTDGGQEIKTWVLRRVLELTFTAWDLLSFAQDCGYSGPPFHWNEERRFLLRCELDAAFFQLYLPADANGEWRLAEGEIPEDLSQLKVNFPTPRDAVAYILDTFPIVKRKDEKKHNSYRTKDTILNIYDAFVEAIRTGRPYQTPLTPPPADSSVAHKA